MPNLKIVLRFITGIIATSVFVSTILVQVLGFGVEALFILSAALMVMMGATFGITYMTLWKYVAPFMQSDMHYYQDTYRMDQENDELRAQIRHRDRLIHLLYRSQRRLREESITTSAPPPPLGSMRAPRHEPRHYDPRHYNPMRDTATFPAADFTEIDELMSEYLHSNRRDRTTQLAQALAQEFPTEEAPQVGEGNYYQVPLKQRRQRQQAEVQRNNGGGRKRDNRPEVMKKRGRKF